MNEWDSRWMDLCRLNNIKLGKSDRYMDDIRAFLKSLKMGWRWVGGSLCYTKSWEEEDRASGRSAARRTALVLVGMMNDVFPFLNFTVELGEDFIDGKLPSLDVAIWVVDRNRIMYEFFEKTMATNLMVEATSALSKEVKLSTLSEEVSRRLRNTSPRLDSSGRLEILEKACVKMKTSGHSEEFIRLAIEQGIRSFDAKIKRSRLEVDHPSFQPLFPKAGWRKDIKSREKALKRSTWFRGRKEDESWENLPKQRSNGGIRKKKKIFRKAGERGKPKQAAATVVFVPSTRGSILLRSLKEDEDMMAGVTGFRVKYQEAGGSILANAFNKNLGSGQSCGRADCPPCRKPEGRENCKARNIVYKSKCLICNPATSHEEEVDVQPLGRSQEPREGIYVGETSRSLHERALEHERDAKAFSPKSHIVKHWMISHPVLPNPPEMEFTISARFKDCLSRQIGEALKINLSKDILLNSKSEYNSNSLNRISIQEDAWERRERGRQEEEEEELVKRSVEEFRKRKTMDPEEYSTDEEEVVKTRPECEGWWGVNTLTGSQSSVSPVSNIVIDPPPAEEEFDNTRPDCEGRWSVNTQTGSQSSVSSVSNIVINSPPTEYSTDEDEFDGRDRVDRNISWSNGEGRWGVHTLTGSQSSVSSVSNIVLDPPPAEYSTDEEEFDGRDTAAVQTTGQALNTRNVPVEIQNTAKREMSVTENRISKLKQGYNLNYFNLWWSRMEVGSRKEAKELKREEEEFRRIERKRKFSINMGWIREDTHRARNTSVDISNINTYLLDNTLGVGDILCPGVTVEGEGEGVVPEIDLINERSQASNGMTQYLDGTRALENGFEPGSLTAEVDMNENLGESESS